MSYTEGILAVGAILLTLIGGIAGNVFTVLVLRILSKRNKNIIKLDYLLLGILIVILAVVTIPFLQILFNTSFSTNPSAFFLSIGILFGVIGSILSNFFSSAYERYIDSRGSNSGWSNADIKTMAWIGGILVLFIAYLLGMFFLFS